MAGSEGLTMTADQRSTRPETTVVWVVRRVTWGGVVEVTVFSTKAKALGYLGAQALEDGHERAALDAVSVDSAVQP